jgi:NADH:ubiquinone oxidoreductase subunit E
VLQRVAEEVRARKLEDLVHLRAAFCLENCSHGPTVKVDGARFSGVGPEDIPGLIERYLESARASGLH